MTESAYIPVPGAELYYTVAGTGDPLLLLHAGIADSRMWQAQVEAFSAHYETICYDQRGFGRTRLFPGAFNYHEDVAAVLDHLGHERASIVAISFGGRVALDFALAYSHRVSALVLGAPSVSGQENSPRVERFFAEEDEALERDDLDGAVELNLRLWVDGPQREPHEVDAGVRRLVGEMQRNAFLVPEPDGVTLKPAPPPAIERLQEIDIPVLLITGTLDLEEKNALAERLWRDLPDVRRLSLPAAHMMSLERPSAFNEGVLSFLRSLRETA